MTYSQKRKQNIARELAYVKERLTEKGYRDFLKALSNFSTEKQQNGGRLNWANFEKRTI